MRQKEIDKKNKIDEIKKVQIYFTLMILKYSFKIGRKQFI